MQTQRLTSPALMLLSSLLLSLPPTLVQAQIVFENSNLPAPQEAGTYEIKPEAGTVHGPHLEYRFSQFDLPQATDSASFTGPAPGVQNVIGLINGASQSIINGTLSCNIPDANLYLLNPNGILIGPTATVNVPGSFYAAAANSVTVDGQTFMVTGNAPIVSSIRANLADFGFVRNPGRLTVRGNINVTGSSSSANLVGDEILVQDANISPPNSFEAKGTVINVQDSTINTTNPGSTVKMEGEQVTVANSQISTVGSFEAKGTTSITVQNKSEIKTTDPGSTVKMEGDRITIEDSKVFGNSTPEDKNGIEVTGKSSVSVINSSLEGAGGAGGGENRIVNARIEVNSAESPDVTGQVTVTVQGGNLVVDNSKVRAVDGGRVEINASTLQLTNRTDVNVNTETFGKKGSVLISVEKSKGSVILSNGTQVRAMVGAGQVDGGEGLSNVVVQANKVEIKDNSGIKTSTFGAKPAGVIQIQGSGADSSLTLLNNSFIEAPTFEKGKGGNIGITNFNQVTLNENSGILASTTTTATGEAGEISIDTDKLDVTKSSIAIGTLGSGMGGGLTINATGKITLTDLGSVKRDYLPLPLEAAIFAGASGSGNATSPGKSVSITTPELAMNHAFIQADTKGSGKAGDIKITATAGIGSVTLDNESFIETPTSAEGRGGNITIDANQVKLTGDSRIGTYTTADGEGGSATINTGTLDVTKSSIAVGTFGSGNGGTLQITATKKITLEGSIREYEDQETGDKTQLYSISAESRGNGNATTEPVRIDTPQLTMRNGSAIKLFTYGEGEAGGLDVKANKVELIGDPNFEEPPPNIDASTFGAKKAGTVRIIPKDDGLQSSVNLSHGAYIQSATFGKGQGGKLNINATQITLEDNSGIFADTGPTSSGEGGAVSINTNDLTVNESSIAVSTTGSGQTGYLQINADNKIDLIGQGKVLDLANHEEVPLFAISVDSRGQGNVNSAIITTPNLNLTDGAVISAATFGSGEGGKLKIEANNLSVKESNIAAATLGSGQGGSIEISSSDINLVGNNPNLPNFSNIDVSSRKFNPINQEISERGKAGSLTIGAFSGKEPNITLTNGASISSATETKGDGGNLNIQANNILMETGTNISAKAEAEGNAGHIKIHASGPLAAQDSQITTESAKSKGGDIEVNTPALAVTGASGSINASVSGQQAGGNISVNVDSLNITDGGSIKSSTDGQGQGGNVSVNANTVVSISGQSSTLASATSNQGPAGSIQITSPQLALAQGGKIDTSSTAQGNSGRITVQTTGLSLSDQAEITAKATAEGHSGDIQVTTSTLNMNNAAKISADSSQGTGNAGSIKINTTAQKADSISLTNNSEITTTANTGAGGTIELHSRDFTLENSKINAEVISGTGSAAPATVTLDTQRLVSRNGTIESSSGGQSSAGNIAITATEYIELTGTTITSETTGSGAAGQITLGTNNAPLPSLTLTGTTISTTSKSSGDSGEISLVVNGDLNLVAGSTLKSESTGGGNPNAKAANITVKSNALTLDGATSEISTSTKGASPAGTITLDATSVTNSGKIVSTATSSGRAGNIQIGNGQRLGELVVNSGGEISTSTEGAGSGGTITVNAVNQVTNSGTITSKASGSGSAGTIKIGGEQPVASLVQNGTISTTTEGAGDGGTITINAANVTTNAGTITSDAMEKATGNAGNIMIGTEKQRVRELNVNKGSTISTTAKGTSSSGNIKLYVDVLKVDGEIKSETKDDLVKAPNEKDVFRITVDKVGTLTMKGGKITTSTTGSRDAGDIEVTAANPDSSTVNISQGGEISSSSSAKKDEKTEEEAKGNAGKISVGIDKDKQHYFNTVTLDTGGKIKTDAVISNSGTIDIHANTIAVSGKDSLISAVNTKGHVDAKAEEAANINVQGNTLTLSDGGNITSSTSGQNPAGTVTITMSDSKTTEGQDQKGHKGHIDIYGQKSGIFSKAENKPEVNPEGVKGPAGEIHLTSSQIDLGKSDCGLANNCQGSRIETSTDGIGAAGTISISASDYINIAGEGSGIFSKANPGAAGNAGEIVIAAQVIKDEKGKVAKDEKGNPKVQGLVGQGLIVSEGSKKGLTVSGGSKISTEANVSNSGQIHIHADTIAVSGNDSSITAVNTKGLDDATKKRQAADINVQGNTLTLSDGGNITSSTSGQNPAGTVTITMSDSKTAEGKDHKGHIDIYGQKSGIFSKAENKPEVNPEGVKGPAGEIHLTSSQIDLGKSDCGLANNCQGSRIETSTDGIGAAGTISISASDYINIAGEGSGIFSKANPGAAGNAGEIVIAAQVIKDEKGKVAKDEKGNPKVQGLVGQGLIVSEGSKKGLTVSGGSKISTEANVSNSGQIHIHADTIAVRDKDSSISAVNKIGHGGATPEDAANIDVQGNTLTLSDGGNITSSTSGQNPAGTISIIAPKIDIGTTDTITAPKIDIGTTEGKTCTTRCGRIESSTTGSGAAGTISISASDYINISGGESGIFSKADKEATGNAGEIVINVNVVKEVIKDEQGKEVKDAQGNPKLGWVGKELIKQKLTLSDGGQISTNASESSLGGGSITVHATNLTITGKDSLPKDNSAITSISSSSNTEGTANIVVNTQKTTLSQRGRIESSTNGLVAAGTISITASEYLKISSPPEEIRKVEEKIEKVEVGGIFSTSEPQDTSNKSGVRSNSDVKYGKAGSITIYAGGTSPAIEFGKAEDSRIPEKVSYFKKSSDSEKWTPDKGLELSGNSQINTSTATSGDGGTIRITASQLALGKGSEISAKEEGTANQAGSIYVGTDTFSMAKDSKISTTAEGESEGGSNISNLKGGGNILIGVNHIPPAAGSKIPRISGKITASVTGGAGKGGNVEITSNNKEVFQKVFHPILKEDGSVTQNGLLFVLDGGEITAKAEVGKGGEIKIDKAIPFAKSGDSEVSASSTFGSDGKVEIPSDVGDMGAISRLPGEPVDVSKLIKDCARKTQGQWSLRQGGRSSSKQDKEKNKEEGCKR